MLAFLFNLNLVSALSPQVEDVLSIVVGGGTSEQIWVKLLVWILVFAVFFNKGTVKIFGDSKKIAVIVALILSTLAVYFAPESIIDWIIKIIPWVVPIALVAGIWWVLSWSVFSNRFKKFITAVIIGFLIYAKHILIPRYWRGADKFFIEHGTFSGIITLVLIIAFVGFLILSFRKSLERKEKESKIRESNAAARESNRNATR